MSRETILDGGVLKVVAVQRGMEEIQELIGFCRALGTALDRFTFVNLMLTHSVERNTLLLLIYR